MANILIVEDNDLNFELASELLKRTHHNTSWAHNAEECFKFLEKERPDLILMDIGLPFEDGFSITEKIKSNILTRDITVVAFTAMVMPEDRQRAIEAGCAGFIPKPIEVSTFVSTVENFIKGQNKSHNILAIDDNPMNAEIIKEALMSVNQNVVQAYSGQEALELIEREKFDLILLDIMMPGMSGFDVIKKLKANPRTAALPVVFVSALDSTDNIVKGFNLGSYEYIVKPFKVAELKARILNILKIKDLQDELTSEKKVFDIISEFSADSIVLLNRDFELLSCNKIFLEWLGMGKKDVLNRKFCEIINCDSKNCILDSDKDNISLNFELQGENRRILGINCTRVYSPQGEVEGYVLVLRDITAYMEIEAQKETFVATLTHDLKTPVRAQLKALQMLLDGKFGKCSDSQGEIITEILNSNKYMASMLDNLLSTYKYENGNVALNRVEFDINTLIKSSCCELKYLAEEKKQNIIFDFEEESLEILADCIEIKRVIHNILYNAINYTCEGGRILISSRKAGNEAVMSFADNGRGMTEAEINSLFNKYSSHAKKFRKVGTGLGLYVSKQIVETHSGKISVESTEGRGSCFTVTLPQIF